MDELNWIAHSRGCQLAKVRAEMSAWLANGDHDPDGSIDDAQITVAIEEDEVCGLHVSLRVLNPRRPTEGFTNERTINIPMADFDMIIAFVAAAKTTRADPR